MSERVFTPGPWEWTAPERAGRHRQRMLEAPDAGRTVLYHDAHWLPTKADARLIAAAPDLLAALRAVEKHHAALNAQARRPEDRSTTLGIVRAALAKAEGK